MARALICKRPEDFGEAPRRRAHDTSRLDDHVQGSGCQSGCHHQEMLAITPAWSKHFAKQTGSLPRRAAEMHDRSLLLGAFRVGIRARLNLEDQNNPTDRVGAQHSKGPLHRRASLQQSSANQCRRWNGSGCCEGGSGSAGSHRRRPRQHLVCLIWHATDLRSSLRSAPSNDPRGARYEALRSRQVGRAVRIAARMQSYASARRHVALISSAHNLERPDSGRKAHTLATEKGTRRSRAIKD
jgi:hypothetical protein